tara:strand:- start:1436 stop:2590 length:1155 start_codon:yes stop_codon:yes gene_type:complete
MRSKNIVFKKYGTSFKNKKKIKQLLKFYSKTKLVKSFSKKYSYSFDKSKIKKYKKFNHYTIIGIGGSSLGIEAIYNFLNFKIKKKFIFKNNLTTKKNILVNKNKNLNIVISKSGNTIETIANFNNIENKKNNLFMCENSNNYLRNLANKLRCEIIEHKNYIGGRYSVLSEVGMLPSILMGLDDRKFKNFDDLIKNKNFVEALVDSVSSTLHFVKNNKLNSVILNYDEQSQDLFKWYQQLIAESLGKKSKGIMPIISTMPKDNHSMMQLYLDGPKNCFYTFFDVFEKNNNVKSGRLILDSHEYLKNKSIYQIKLAQKEAAQIVFKKKNIPFRSFNLTSRSERSIGEMFTFFMLETILLGNFLKVNPFDQPSVELIKVETKKILKN